MEMVCADDSSQSLGGLTAQIGWFGLRLAAQSAFIKWTGWTLAMTVSWWQHHKHCHSYYYYYHYLTVTCGVACCSVVPKLYQTQFMFVWNLQSGKHRW